MSFDLRLSNTCDHKIIDEILEIEGATPSFTAKLRSASNKSKSTTFIREYNTAEALTSPTVFTVGITNWIYDPAGDGSEIIFGTFPVELGTRYPDPRTTIAPRNVYLVDYVAAGNCIKCQDQGIIRDISLDTLGRYKTVESVDKIRQQVRKALETVLGSNQFDVLYGAGLENLIGSQLDQFTLIDMQQRIQDALNHLIQIQASQDLPADETIVRISDVAAEQDQQDPTKLNITVQVTTASFDEVPATFFLGLV
jgi:phage baseplate assembly protein W